MDVTYIPFSFPGLPQVGCAFQTRTGGCSQGSYGGGNISLSVGDTPQHVCANRASLVRTLGVDAFAELKQVHGDGMVFDPAPAPLDRDAEIEGDGLATSRPALALMIKTADCQPILLAHSGGHAVAAIHVGWRGNRSNFPASAVARFCEHYGIAPKDVLAVRGPSLGPAQAEFVNFADEWGTSFSPWYSHMEKVMDLWSLTRHQLQEAGLVPAHIYGLDMCTATMRQSFFSYRQDKTCGRQASLVWLRR